MLDFVKISKLDLSEMIDYIIVEFHDPLREKLLEIRKYGTNMKRDCGNENKNLNLLLELFNQFEQEIINHINREETEFFPEILKLCKGEVMKKNNLKIFLRLQEIEHNEIDNYLIGGKSVIEDLCLDNNSNYLKLKEIVEDLYLETLNHVYIENNFLNIKVKNKMEEI